MVPTLYEGPFSQDALERCTDGPTLVGGLHIREGVVVRTERERSEDFGRVILKSVSESYLTRRGGTEFN